MKKKNIIEGIICIGAFAIAVWFYINWEPQTLIRMKKSTVTMETIQRNPGKNFVGHRPGDDIPILQTAADIVTAEGYYMTVKAVDIAPTNVYTFQPWADPYHKVRKGKRYVSNGKPKARVVQSDFFPNDEYKRYYVLKLEDGSHVFAQLPSQYVSAIKKGKDVTLPIAKREWLNDGSEEYLEQFSAQYGIKENCMLYFFNNDWYKSNSLLFKSIRLSAAFCVYLIMVFVFITIIKKMLGDKTEEENEKIDKELLYGE